ncbi:MAG TPA: carbohydrate-binding family 9-like protein [Thermomicrobiales bacterium]
MVEQHYAGAAEVADYTCYRVREPLPLDGRLEAAAWQQAPQSPRFVDVVSGRPGLYDTRAAALWDDEALYIGFWLEEPFVTAELTERDSLIFYENDIEVFIDGGDCYYEFEMNALGTIYEVFLIWQDAYRRGSKFDIPEFDLLGRPALSFGGNFDRVGQSMWWGAHPRKARWAFPDWDFPGVRAAVFIDGKLNDPTTVDRGWRVELAFPWSGMGLLADGRALPPRDGDIWRLLFARYEKLHLLGNDLYTGWAWNRIGSIDNHAPECFTRLHFSTQYVDER